MKHLTNFILVVLFFTSSIYAQTTITGEFRPRTELRHGYKALAATGQELAAFTSQRTRLNINYANDNFKTGFSIQDIRTWGSEKQLNTTDVLMSVHQAWAEVMFGENLSLKTGRQEIIYDDHRIFGSVGWAQQARSHDLAILKYEKDFKIHFGYAYNQDKEQTNTNYYTVNGRKNYKSFQYLWFNKSFESLKLSLLFLNNGMQNDTTGAVTAKVIYSQTVGTKLAYKVSDKFKLSANFYYQMGKDASENSLSALNYNIDFNYKLNDNISLIAGNEYLSGTSQKDQADPAINENHSFTPFYGTNHKFNGHMDYFYVGNHSNSVGLIDTYIKVKYKKDKFSAGCDIHYFMAAADIYSTSDATFSNKLESTLGTEIDFSAGYKIAPGVVAKVGYSHMLATSTMEALKGGNKGELNNWGWVMLIIKPTFYKGE